MPRETIESLLEKIKQAHENPVETRPSRRDVLRRWRPRIGLGIILAGAATSVLSGKVFLDKYNQLAEEAASNRLERYDNIVEGRDFGAAAKKDDDTLIHGFYGIVGGAAIACAGYLFARGAGGKKRWKVRSAVYGESFSDRT